MLCCPSLHIKFVSVLSHPQVGYAPMPLLPPSPHTVSRCELHVWVLRVQALAAQHLVKRPGSSIFLDVEHRCPQVRIIVCLVTPQSQKPHDVADGKGRGEARGEVREGLSRGCCTAAHLTTTC